ncbi:PepSY domain-containing protein [Thalassospira profundimaris]|uniref:PepSY domain-containing protein n=1 Tax=Thalassospira profundimaris TaxID=502049 RepID=UPI000DED559F|nr:PepSY domain-containing protein [Thalassospira profundimaris]
MTFKFPRCSNSVATIVAIAALTAGVAGTAAASNEPSETQANAAADVIAQASQAPAEEPAAEKSELSMEQVIAKVKEQGYSDISEIEREGDRYEVMAKNAEGKKVEIYVDAKTGEIIKKDKGDKAALSKDEVIAKLKEQGYPEVSKIEREREGDQYWVMARDVDGKKFELHVNAKTGEITRKEQEGK